MGDPYCARRGCRPGQFACAIGRIVFILLLISGGLRTFIPGGWYPRWRRLSALGNTVGHLVVVFPCVVDVHVGPFMCRQEGR